VDLPTPYDVGSLMHYSASSFSSDGNPTIIAVNPAFQPVIGARSMPSARDIATLNFIGDPLSGSLLCHGNWGSIRLGHELIAIDGEHVFDWEPNSGSFRVWAWDAHARGSADPMPGDPLANGTLDKFARHRLFALGSGLVLDWDPHKKTFATWKFDPTKRGKTDPFPGKPIATGPLAAIAGANRILPLGENQLLDWDAKGNFRLWSFDPKRAEPPAKLTSGTWSTIDTTHRLVRLADDNVLDVAGNDYRVWRHDSSARNQKDPLPNPEIARGKWSTINDLHELIPIGGKQVLDWVPVTGDYRVWSYGSKFDGFRPNPLSSSPLYAGTRPELGAGRRAVGLDHDHVLTWGSGAFELWKLDVSGPAGSDAFSSHPVKSGTGIGAHEQVVNLGGSHVLAFDAKASTARLLEIDLRSTTPFVKSVLTTHTYSTTLAGQIVTSLGGTRVLMWDPGTQHSTFRVYDVVLTAKGTANPLSKVASGSLSGITDAHTLIAPGAGHLVDWIHDAGWYRVYPIKVTPATLVAKPTIAEGFWSDIAAGKSMTVLSRTTVLEWTRKDGSYRIWGYAPKSVWP
jgi:hypothetical protein